MPKFSDLLPGILQGYSEAKDKDTEQRRKLQQLITAAFATEQAKAAYPSEEEKAKRQAAQLIAELNPEPTAPMTPTISVSPQTTFTPSGGRSTAISPLEAHALTAGGYAGQITTPEARTNRLLDIFRGRQQDYQTQVQDRRSRILQMMQERGLLPQRQPSLLEQLQQAKAADALLSDFSSPAPSQPGSTPLRSTSPLEGVTVGILPTGKIGLKSSIEQTLSNQRAMARARAEGTTQGRPLTPEAATTATSADAAIGGIDQLIHLEQQNPGSIKKAILLGATPGGVGLIAGSPATQRAQLLLKRIQTEITTARGGKQLTATEIRFIGQILPSLFRGGALNIQGLQDLRQFLEKIHSRILLGRADAEQPTAPTDLSPKAAALLKRHGY